MSTTAVYAQIVKHERDPTTGDLVVFGRATGPELDLDRQVCDPAWLKTAVPAWFSSGANVREQHSPIAAGVGQEIVEKPDGGWDLKALVVDPVSARKVESGVLKGYSIGIRNPQVVKDAAAPGGRITGGQIVEVSLVDRPANPACTLVLAKALRPGPQTASAVDTERHLVKVEELHDRTGEPLAALKALGIDLDKAADYDEAEDIADAQTAIAIIARLIGREAEHLGEGMASEACDIDLLLSAIRALEWFQKREKNEEATVATVDLAAKATTEKTTGPAPAEQKPTDRTTPDLSELVAKAVADAIAPVQAQLDKALAQPAPGGPVLTRTSDDTAKASAREGLLTKAAEYDRLAYELSDPQARTGYLELAAKTRGAAATL